MPDFYVKLDHNLSPNSKKERNEAKEEKQWNTQASQGQYASISVEIPDELQPGVRANQNQT